MLSVRERGVTLIELAIGLAIVAILLMLGLPAWNVFLQNTQIRNAGESVLQGLNLARAEAVRRNTTVRFQFVNNLAASCALSGSSLNWVVSLGDTTNLCNVAPADPGDTSPPTGSDPKIVQKQSGTEGTRNVVLAATGGNTVIFNGVGRVLQPPAIPVAPFTQIDLSNSRGTCQHTDATNGTMRCLRVLVSTGGQVKLCDPKVTDNTDPRFCA